MITEKPFFRALEMAIASLGEEVSPMSNLIGQRARVFTFPNRVATYSFFAADAIFREDGTVVVQEANGSNGASTGMLPHGQLHRARHMADAALSRPLETPCVAILAHADRTDLKAEFYARQALFAKELEAAGIGTVNERIAGEHLGVEDIAVVIGPVSKLVEHLEARDGALYYMERKVGFATNANLLPALQRMGKIQRTENGFSVNTDIFHEGAGGVQIVLNKAEQQRVAVGSGLTPLRYAECPTWESAVTEIRKWHGQGYTPVAKISAGSQGVGIGFFPRQRAASIQNEIHRMRELAFAAYGPQADETALPVQLFEFATSTRYCLEDGDHLWDIRIECYVSPGHTTLVPASMRICPAPFDIQQFSRDSVLSNLSGRGCGLQFVRTPFHLHSSGQTELEGAGVTETKLNEAIAAFASWCESALGAGSGTH